MEPNSKFESALRRFGDSMIAQQLLGEWDGPFPRTWLQDPIDPSLPMDQRIELLSAELEGWIELKADELDEFDGPDLERLRGEAVGAMYALRELRRHFPKS